LGGRAEPLPFVKPLYKSAPKLPTQSEHKLAEKICVLLDFLTKSLPPNENSSSHPLLPDSSLPLPIATRQSALAYAAKKLI